MIEIVWEFVVQEESRGLFELAYGPGGAWSRLIDRSPGFRGATLLRDMKQQGRYLCIELWDSEAQRDKFLSEHKSENAILDAKMAEWTARRSEVGTFRVLAEATVRPRNSARKGKSGEVLRRRRRKTR